MIEKKMVGLASNNRGAISLTVMAQFNDAYMRHLTTMITVTISTDTSDYFDKYNGYDVNRNRNAVFFKNINTD